MTSPLIILIEDEEHLATGLLFNLEAEGYLTLHFADGAEALAFLLETNEEIGIILLDVRASALLPCPHADRPV